MFAGGAAFAAPKCHLCLWVDSPPVKRTFFTTVIGSLVAPTRHHVYE